MKAFVLQRYGGPDAARLTDVPEPIPGPEDVLVKIHAAGLNPVDYKFRQGMLRPIFRPKLPFVMGNEFAGTVVRCGEKVSGFRSGDRVFACSGVGHAGAWADFASLPASLLAVIPANVDFVEAASIPLAGLTALQCLRDELRVQPGRPILITGGAGGVGTLAIQLARWLQAHVVTTTSPHGKDLVQELGAHEVIDYTRQRLADSGHRFEYALDLVGGKTLIEVFEVVTPGGRVLSIAGIPEPRTAKDLQGGRGLAGLFWIISVPLRFRALKHGVDYRYYFMRPSGEELAQLAQLLQDRTLRPVIDRILPFDQIRDALSYLEEGHAKGKVVIRME